MRATTALWRHSIRLTLFTRDNCSLCTDAKRVLSRVKEKRPFEYDEINVMHQSQTKWKNLYEYDVPVVHADRLKAQEQNETHHSAPKIMHRFTEAEVEQLMDKAEQS